MHFPKYCTFFRTNCSLHWCIKHLPKYGEKLPAKEENLVTFAAIKHGCSEKSTCIFQKQFFSAVVNFLPWTLSRHQQCRFDRNCHWLWWTKWILTFQRTSVLLTNALLAWLVKCPIVTLMLLMKIDKVTKETGLMGFCFASNRGPKKVFLAKSTFPWRPVSICERSSKGKSSFSPCSSRRMAYVKPSSALFSWMK